MHAIAANKPDLVTDCGKGAVVTEPPVPKEQPTQTVISCVDADSLPAASAEADVVRNSASSNQQDKMQAHKRCRSPSDPIIKAEPIVKAELVVKAEPSTATSNLGTSHQEPTSKRRKIADTHTHSTKPANRPKLFSTTIDITGDAPMVKPKPLTTIDLTEDFSPLIQPEEPNSASTLSTAGRPPVKQELSPTPSTPVNTEPSHPSNSRQTNPVSVKEEPSTSSRTSIDAAPQPSRSGPGFAMLTPTEIAEQGGCLIQ